MKTNTEIVAEYGTHEPYPEPTVELLVYDSIEIQILEPFD